MQNQDPNAPKPKCYWCESEVPVQTPCICEGPCEHGYCPMLSGMEEFVSPAVPDFGKRKAA